MNDPTILKMGVIRIGGRGTSRRVADKEEDNWSGTAFKKYSEEQKEAAKDRYISMGRGTAKIKFSDVASTETKSSKGMWVGTGRGTGRRKLD